MIYLLGGYIWLFVHRPFEYWTMLGDVHLERVYMAFVLLAWLFYPGKGWCANRMNKAILFFSISILLCWLASSYDSALGGTVVEEHFKVGVLFLLLVTTVDDEKKLKQILLFFFVSMFLYQFHSFYEFLNGRYEYRMKTVRMNGVNQTHGDPNTFSGMLIYALPFLAPFWMTAKKSSTKSMIVGYVLLTMLCVYLTGSRRAYIGIGVIAILLAIRSARSENS